MKAKATSIDIRRSLIIALYFQIAWLVVGGVGVLAGGEVSWPLLFANLVTLWAPALFIVITRTALPASFQYGFAAFITASSLIGSALGGYGAIPNWDTLVHIYSGTLLAWFGFIIVGRAEASVKKRFPRWFSYIAAFMTPLAFAALWEIYEFTSDLLLGTSMQAGGLEDTIVDMAAAVVGSIVAVLVKTLIDRLNSSSSK